jgi:hypothetical protein
MRSYVITIAIAAANIIWSASAEQENLPLSNSVPSLELKVPVMIRSENNRWEFIGTVTILNKNITVTNPRTSVLDQSQLSTEEVEDILKKNPVFYESISTMKTIRKFRPQTRIEELLSMPGASFNTGQVLCICKYNGHFSIGASGPYIAILLNIPPDHPIAKSVKEKEQPDKEIWVNLNKIHLIMTENEFCKEIMGLSVPEDGAFSEKVKKLLKQKKSEGNGFFEEMKELLSEQKKFDGLIDKVEESKRESLTESGINHDFITNLPPDTKAIYKIRNEVNPSFKFSPLTPEQPVPYYEKQ